MRSRPSNTVPFLLNVCPLPARRALPGSHARYCDCVEERLSLEK
jgi:hypothetical protein